MTKRFLYTSLIILFVGWLSAYPGIISAVETQQKVEPTIEEYVNKMKGNGLSPQEQKDLASLLEERSSRSKLLEEFLSNIQNSNNNQEENRFGKTELMIITFMIVFSLVLIWGSLILFAYYLWQGVHLRATRAKKLGLDISP